MGIKNLFTFLKSRKIEFKQQLPLVELRKIVGKLQLKMAIDTSLYLYKYKYIYRNNFLSGFNTLIIKLKSNNIEPIFILDAKDKADSSSAKSKEVERRKLELEKQKTRLQALKDQLSELQETAASLEELEKVSALKTRIHNMERSLISISEDDIKAIKGLFTAYNLEWIVSSVEGEIACCSLVDNGSADVVLTEDSDTLAYCSSFREVRVLLSIDASKKQCTYLNKSAILDSLELSSQSFRDLCILMGTDFNSNCKKVGPVNAYKCISKWSSFEELEKNEIITDLHSIDWRDVREKFAYKQNFEVEKNSPEKHYSPKELKEYLVLHNIVKPDSKYNFKLGKRLLLG